MQFHNIHSEALLRKLIELQQGLLERQSLPKLLDASSTFFLSFSKAEYIGISFIKPNALYEMQCRMGDDHGLFKLFHNSSVGAAEIFKYVKTLNQHELLINDGRLCRFFRLPLPECNKVDAIMQDRILLLRPLKRSSDEQWVGLAVLLMPSNAPLEPALEVCDVLDMVVAPFFDIESGLFAEHCIHESSRFGELSPREKEIARHMLHGMSQKEISQKLSLSINTVKSHIKKIYQKYNINNHLEFINRFLKR